MNKKKAIVIVGILISLYNAWDWWNSPPKTVKVVPVGQCAAGEEEVDHMIERDGRIVIDSENVECWVVK